MDGPIYFQWQNEVLLKTIYPLREMKLRDVLIYFAEIDLWSEYKDRSIADIQDEVQSHIQAQSTLVVERYQAYQKMRAYFQQTDLRAFWEDLLGVVDETELTKIHQVHTVFATYLPKTTDIRREKSLVFQQLPSWENHRMEVRRIIASKKRRVEAMIPTHPNRSAEIQALALMEKAGLGMVDGEWKQIKAYIAAIEKIEPRMRELQQAQEKARLRKQEVVRKLNELQPNIPPLQSKFDILSGEITRLKNPPPLEPVQAYLASSDVPAQLLSLFPQADSSLIKKLAELRKAFLDEFNYIISPQVKLSTARNHLYNWQQYLKGLEKEAAALEITLRNLPPTDYQRRAEKQTALAKLRDVSIRLAEAEVNRLSDFYSAFEHSVRPQADLEKAVEDKQKELARVEQSLSLLTASRQTLESELAALETTLAIDPDAYMVEFHPEKPVTIKDIVLGRVEAYRAELLKLDADELLEEVVRRFIEKPERYPLWLQYMIIHFSGMRYASAHGSWADPKDLIVRLRVAELEKEFAKLDDNAIAARCQVKLGEYAESVGTSPASSGLLQSNQKEWRTKLDYHLQGIRAVGPKTRRAALLALLTDELRYDLAVMTLPQALDILKGMKEQFPAWAWKEIVRLTELRVTEVTDPGWEKLTPEEEAARMSRESEFYRVVIGKWKDDNMGNWRDEHGRSHRLIVARAVCNETAEHCQHLRGHLPPGGLTAKAPWYLGHERNGTLTGQPRPYFTKAKGIEDYTVGASVLWVRFVTEDPTPWRIANPLVTKDGDTLISAELMNRRAKNDEPMWVYKEGDMVTRTRTYLDEKKQRINQSQWLRWIHEATVAEVGETAEGPVVLTFETALPSDDPALAAIGLFKHYLHNILYDGTEDNYNRSFVGFVPEGQIPAKGFEEMLDWNKILRREVLAPEQMQAWRQKHLYKGS